MLRAGVAVRGCTPTGGGYERSMGSGEVARRYHRDTNQAPRRLPRSDVSGFMPMDPRNRPEPFKRYPQAPVHPLPTDLPPKGAPAAVALSGRVPAAETAPDLELLARLLFFSAGVTRVARGASPIWFRAAPSAGNLHPLEMYVVADATVGLKPGLYHFAPDAFGLEQLSTGDCRAALAEAVAAPEIAASPLVLVLTGIPWRTAWKYAERGWRHVYWDAGTLLANLFAVADAYGQPVRVLVGFVDAAVCRRLGIDGVAEFPVAVMTVGAGRDTSASAGGPTEPRATATALSPMPIEFPLITRAYQAGELTTTEQVVAWRTRSLDRPPGAPNGVDPLAEVHPTPIESVVLRRGSTRQMRPAVAPPELLHWAMAVASRQVPADAVPAGTSLLSHQLAVHAVRGVESGLYRVVDGKAELHRAAPETDVRRLSEHLCLDQPLGGDSAYTDFICADLDAVLHAYGDRGYRLAQLEAGVAAGRLQLAAFALGHGGTGLTFYDQEISAAFDTRAACLLAVSIGRPAYQAKPGGPPGRPTQLS
jgi:SagB-type dehydrogenase family enzyme